MNPGVRWDPRILAAQRSQTWMSPLSDFSSTRAPPLPWVKLSSLPGVYLLLLRGFGPKQASISPLNDSMSKSAFTGGLTISVSEPLTVSISTSPAGRVRMKLVSPETELTCAVFAAATVAWMLAAHGLALEDAAHARHGGRPADILGRHRGLAAATGDREFTRHRVQRHRRVEGPGIDVATDGLEASARRELLHVMSALTVSMSGARRSAREGSGRLRRDTGVMAVRPVDLDADLALVASNSSSVLVALELGHEFDFIPVPRGHLDATLDVRDLDRSRRGRPSRACSCSAGPRRGCARAASTAAVRQGVTNRSSSRSPRESPRGVTTFEYKLQFLLVGADQDARSGCPLAGSWPAPHRSRRRRVWMTASSSRLPGAFSGDSVSKALPELHEQCVARGELLGADRPNSAP